MALPRSIACALVGFAACSGGSTDIDPTLRFADLTDLEIGRLVSAASGTEGFSAQSQVLQFDFQSDQDPCPLVEEDLGANTATITGGCTTADGVAIEGSASVTNPLGWGDLAYDFGDDTRYQFDQFALVQAGQRMAYDGVMRTASTYDEIDMDVTTESFGLIVRSDLYMDCGQTSCDLENSGIELVGVGGALVSGTINVRGTSTGGGYTLRGVDTVKVTIEQNCVSWQLTGTDRAFSPCP